jgi:hypothetical protein
MIQIPKKHMREVLVWLHENIGANWPSTNRTKDDPLAPGHVKTTAMRAVWYNQDGAWRIQQSGWQDYVSVECQDPAVETYITTRWS